MALAGVAQWIERQPVKDQKVVGLIPSQDTGLGCGWGRVRGNGQRSLSHTLMFLSPSLSLSPPCSIKIIK